MHTPVRRSELLAVARLPAMLADHLSAATVAIDQRLDFEREPFELAAQSDALVETGCIGRQRDRCADFAQRVRLLVNVDLNALLAQCQPQREAADAAADHCDLPTLVCHVNLLA